MIGKRGIIGVASLILAALVVYLSPIACSQEVPDDADILIGAMDVEQGDWVADVGSGEGEYTLQMAKAVGDSGRAFAVDINEHDLEDLNEVIEDRGVENITTIFSIYTNPMLPRRTIDAVLIRNAYHEFTAHESMLRHIRAALKPGGRLVMAEYIGVDVIDDDRDTQVDDHELAMRYARKELKQAGFEIAREVEAIQGDPDDDYRMWMIVARRPGGGSGS